MLRKVLDRMVGTVSNAGLAIGMFLTFAMVIHVSAEVVARQLFSRPLVATVEIVSFYYMVAVAFVPLGLVQRRQAHIVAEAIAAVVPKSLQGMSEILGKVLSVLVTAALLYSSALIAMRKTGFGEAVMTAHGELPTWPSRWLVVIGFSAMLLVMLVQLFEPFKGTADETADEAKENTNNASASEE